MTRITGNYEKLGSLDYFIPHSLPPENPPLQLDDDTMHLYGQAMHELGRLNEMANRLPDLKRFIKAYVIKEAMLSSLIEGIQTTIVDVFTTSIIDTKPSKETQLVVNYSHALDAVLELTQKQGYPIVFRVIARAHEVLMSSGDGDKASPGQYRKQTVRVGYLVPPPTHKISDLMADLERYINTDNSLAPLIKAGLAHVQFETIHPFLDGNGRIGRLLIVLMLIDAGLLNSPIIYPSYYFKKNHLAYYQYLDRVRTHGDFEGWIRFYLEAIKQSSSDAYRRALDIEQLEQDLKNLINSDEHFTTMQDKSTQALSILFQQPVISATELAKRLEKSFNTANKIISLFVKAHILEEINSQKRNRLFRFNKYLELLEKEY